MQTLERKKNLEQGEEDDKKRKCDADKQHSTVVERRDTLVRCPGCESHFESLDLVI